MEFLCKAYRPFSKEEMAMQTTALAAVLNSLGKVRMKLEKKGWLLNQQAVLSLTRQTKRYSLSNFKEIEKILDLILH